MEYFQTPQSRSNFKAYRITPTERTRLSYSETSGLQLFDLTSNRQDTNFTTPFLMVAYRNSPSNLFSIKVNDAAYSPDGSKIAAALADSTVRILDAHTGSELGALAGPSLTFSLDGKVEAGIPNKFQSLTFLPGDKAFRAANQIGSTVTNIASGSRIGFEGGIGRVLAQSADASFVLAIVIDQSFIGVTKLALINRRTESETMMDFPAGASPVGAFSPDGKLVVAGAADGSLRVWDSATGKKVLDIPGPKGENFTQMYAVAFAAGGSRIVSFDFDHILHTWDAVTGKEVLTVPQVSKGFFVKTAVFSQDGSRMLTGNFFGVKTAVFSQDGSLFHGNFFGSDDQVKLWDTQTGKLIRSYAGSMRDTQALAFSPDGRLCAAEALDGAIHAWDVESGRVLMEVYTGQTMTALGDTGVITFSSDGKELLSTGADGSVYLWDVATGKRIRSFEGHTEAVTSVAYSKDGAHILTASLDGSVRLWDASTKEPLLRMSADSSTIKNVAISPGGHLAATGEFSTEIRLWDCKTGILLRTFTGHHGLISSMSFSPDGNQLLTGSWDGTARLWNVETGETVREFTGHSDMVLSVAFSSDGAFVATGSRDNTVNIWESSTGKLLHTFTGHTNSVVSLAFSPDNKLVSSGSYDGTARIWSLDTWESKAVFSEGKGKVYAAEFAANGTRLITISEDAKLRVWDLQTKSLVHIFDETALAEALAVYPDGKTVALGDDEHMVRIVDLDTGEPVRRLEDHTGKVNAVAISADGRILLSGSDDHTARLWDSRTGTWLQTLGSRTNDVYTLTFSEDGQSALAGYANGDVYEWNLTTGGTTHVYHGGGAAIRSVTYAGNERFVFGGGDDSVARLWDRETGRQVASLLNLSNGSWAVVDPAGRFDTSDLDGGAPLHWVLSSEPMRPLPLEIFMRDYYTPRLLSRIMNGEKLPEIRSIAEIRDRVQPQVEIVSVTGSKTYLGRVDVMVHEASVTNAKGQASGLQGLRLFRDGQLVANTELNKPLPDGDSAFKDIQLLTSAKSVTFTAYAFNSERIKSPTVAKEYAYEPGTARKPRAWLVQIGVNHYQAQGCELHGSVNDAEELSKVLSQRLKDRGLDVQPPMLLISDHQKNGATKEGIRDALHKIATAATPDDVFFLSFSGHGYGDKSGQFYILPSDIEGSCTGVNKTLLKQAISADELAEWLRPIDAGEMTFVLDSCQSASSVEANDFKPGPMGSKGLGQLAYDKRIRILAASQGDQAARETNLLARETETRGLLSYTLTLLGLDQGKADWKPVDGKITVGEWLTFAADTVPKLLEAGGAGRGIQLENATPGKATAAQVPAVFDFSKRDSFVLQERSVAGP
jgi:WD40 repeat protein